MSDDCPVSSKVNSLKFIHVETKSNLKDNLKSGETIGKVSNYPISLSKKFDKEILLSQTAYRDKNFTKAALLLENAYKEENTNVFILENYARALYQIENRRDESYLVYKKLVDQLDKEYSSSDSLLTIDLWFKEAYWKLGTLYMDNNKWDSAILEIGRFICSIQGDNNNGAAYEQALSFLTECAFNLENIELCLHFAKRTLKYNPKNTYVKEFTDKL